MSLIEPVDIGEADDPPTLATLSNAAHRSPPLAQACASNSLRRRAETLKAFRVPLFQGSEARVERRPHPAEAQSGCRTDRDQRQQHESPRS